MSTPTDQRYFQDGADFYNDVTGEIAASAPFKVTDFDMGAAGKARAWFEEWARERTINILWA